MQTGARCWLGLALLLFGAQVVAKEVQFNQALLLPGLATRDLKRYATGNPLFAGDYPSDVYVNDSLMQRETVRMQDVTGPGSAAPCMSRELLELARIDPEHVALPPHELDDPDACIRIEKISAQLHWQYDVSNLALYLTVPQSLQISRPRDWIDPSRWDAGEAVAWVDYAANSYWNESDSGDYRSHYLGTQMGANVGAWRLRHQANFQSNPQQRQWQSIASYAYRALPQWHSSLSLGQRWTGGEFFDAFGYVGGSLSSDPRMLAESQRGFAPMVRGVARTHARVEIRQNGTLLYEENVAPGNFLIDDLYSTGYAGDLQVTIHESDGSTQTFRVPYSSVPGLIREGQTFYSLTAGKVDEELASESPSFTLLTLQHGLSSLVTGYGGLLQSEDYQALLLGSAWNAPLGAISFDWTRSRFAGVEGRSEGDRYRLGWSRRVGETFVSATLTRHSSPDYYGVREALSPFEHGSLDLAGPLRLRQRADLSLSLPLYDGSLYLLGSRQWFWDAEDRQTTYQLGYSDRWKSVGYQLSVQRMDGGLANKDTVLGLTLNMPLGRKASLGAGHLSMQMSQGRGGERQLNSVLSGIAGDDSQYIYSVMASHRDRPDADGLGALGVNLGYRAAVADYDVGLSQDNQHQRQMTLGAKGAMVAHAGGVEWVPALGDTFAIIKAPNATGAKVAGWRGLQVSEDGYAIVPYLTPYQANRVGLDTNGLDDDVELTETAQWLVPDAGAAVSAFFVALKGYSILLDASWDDKAAPFGADVFDEKGVRVGVVGQAGQLYARVSSPDGVLSVRWGADANSRCHIPYRLGAEQEGLIHLPGRHVCEGRAPSPAADTEESR